MPKRLDEVSLSMTRMPGLEAVIPEGDGLVHLPIDVHRELAVAGAERDGLQLSDPIIEGRQIAIGRKRRLGIRCHRRCKRQGDTRELTHSAYDTPIEWPK